jgi:hypothetical protein
MSKPRLLIALACALAALVGPAQAIGNDRMYMGAAEDEGRNSDPQVAMAKMQLAKAAGFDTIRITAVWEPGRSAVPADELLALQAIADAGTFLDMHVVATVMNFGSRTTPLTAAARTQFARFAADIVRRVPLIREYIVGNEPNLNRYWLPQFDASGGDAAATAYEALLARTYDAVKAVSPNTEVIGGALSPRGGDDPTATVRPTHSPTQFIVDVGAAYQASGRTLPIMDALSLHPYEDHSSVAPANGTHPNTTSISLADYGKLVALLGQAFDGTGQPGSSLPIYFDEFGVESQIPPGKLHLYTGTEPAVTEPVDEATQAAYYKQAIQLSFCDPTVKGFFLFHAVDENALAGWQSGVYYADDAPKTSLLGVRSAIQQAARGVVAMCSGLALTPKPVVTQKGKVLTLTCDLDCTYVAQLYQGYGRLLLSKKGFAIGGRPTTLPLRVPTAKAVYRLRLSALAPVNPGPAALLRRQLKPG